jgi:hypothetical protein
VIPEQSSSLLMEMVAFLNGGMRMSQRPRSSRPAFPPAAARSRCSLPPRPCRPECGVVDEHRSVDHEPKGQIRPRSLTTLGFIPRSLQFG